MCRKYRWNDKFIFINRFGGPHNPATVNRAIKRIVDAHNAEKEVTAKKRTDNDTEIFMPYL